MRRKSGDLHRMSDDMYRRWNRKVSMDVCAGAFPDKNRKGKYEISICGKIEPKFATVTVAHITSDSEYGL